MCGGDKMKFKVHFINCKDYLVAEANNGAVSEGNTLEECKKNIIDAIRLLEEDKDTKPNLTVGEELIREDL